MVVPIAGAIFLNFFNGGKSDEGDEDDTSLRGVILADHHVSSTVELEPGASAIDVAASKAKTRGTEANPASVSMSQTSFESEDAGPDRE